MKHKKEKSNIFNWDGYIIAMILWGITIFCSFNLGFAFVAIILCIVILAIESKSTLLRNHAGQALAVNLLIFVLILIRDVLNLIVVPSFILGGLLSGFMVLIVQFASFIILGVAVGFSAYSMIKAYDLEEVHIPILDDIAVVFTKTIHK